MNLIVLLGPTASGKTKLAALLANYLQTEIISADSRQVYKHLNIGTGKDYEEYRVNHTHIPYHLIDLVEPTESFHITEYLQHFYQVFTSLQVQHKTPILCGGSGLYLQAAISNFEFTEIPVNETLRMQLQAKTSAELIEIWRLLPPTSYTTLADTSTHKRLIRAIEISTYLATHPFVPKNKPIIKPLILGLDLPKKIRNEKIDKRLEQRLQNGLIDEVKQLLKQGVTHEKLDYFGLEYKFVSQHLKHLISAEELTEKLKIAIHQFAKRQMTYFRKMEKDGFIIHWIDATIPLEDQVHRALKIINQHT